MTELINLVSESNRADNTKLLFAFPAIRHIFPDLSGWNFQKNIIKKTHEVCREMVQDHQETFQSNAPPRDFIDVYLKKISDDKEKVYNLEELLIIVIDLFIAGSETTSTTLNWIVRYMIEYPEVQRKVQQELDCVLGDSSPTLAHRGQLVYTEAVILEVLRLAAILPFSIPHRATANIRYQGSTNAITT